MYVLFLLCTFLSFHFFQHTLKLFSWSVKNAVGATNEAVDGYWLHRFDANVTQSEHNGIGGP